MPKRGPSVDHRLFRTLNALTDGIVSAVGMTKRQIKRIYLSKYITLAGAASHFLEYLLASESSMSSRSLEEMKAFPSLQGRIAVLDGKFIGEQIMPKNFPFYNPEEHRRLNTALEEKAPAAVIAVRQENNAHEDTELSAYPCPPLFANNGEDYYSSAGMLSYLEQNIDLDRTVLAINIDGSQDVIAIP